MTNPLPVAKRFDLNTVGPCRRRDLGALPTEPEAFQRTNLEGVHP
jgi:hypothetical protein